MGVRATSFVASAALLSLLAIGGLTMTIVQRQIEIALDGPIVDIVPPPSDPPPVHQQTQPPPRPIVTDDSVAAEPLAPLEPLTEISTTQTAPFGVSEGPVTITNPDWVRRPRNLAIYYPARALGRGVEGRVVLDCSVSTQGSLACAVVSETPSNWGFAEAALRISRDYRMVPAMRNGQAVEGRHRMVVPFEIR